MRQPSEPAIDLSPSPGDEVKTTTCYMCACRCGIKVWLADGGHQDKVIRYIQGNPAHPVNQGVICAKGAAGIMQHYSPARLEKPLLRVGERGKGEFREIEWDEALQIATDWLAPIRERNPDELAFFTGRDQSQALTGWWAQQFGTINYAAHGGFCSVNMAAGGLYTLGGSFWEFGEPDWDHTQYLMLWGVAEDHDSNPIKLGLGKLKARGAKIVAVNPVRTGYGAIADEWIGIRPGTDGLFAFALIHELLRMDRIDLDYLVRYANAHWLVVRNPGGADDGLFARDVEGNVLCWAVAPPPAKAGEGAQARADAIDISPAVVGEYPLAVGPPSRHGVAVRVRAEPRGWAEGRDRPRRPGAVRERARAGGAQPGRGGGRAVRARRRRQRAVRGCRPSPCEGRGGSSGKSRRKRHLAGRGRRIHPRRRPQGRPGVPADSRAIPRSAVRPGSRQRTMRHPRRHHRPHRARTRAGRVRQQAHAAHRLDRRLGPRARRDGRPPGLDARHARHQRAQQRLPHLPRAAPAAAAAGRGGCARFVPLPAAVSQRIGKAPG